MDGWMGRLLVGWIGEWRDDKTEQTVTGYMLSDGSTLMAIVKI